MYIIFIKTLVSRSVILKTDIGIKKGILCKGLHPKDRSHTQKFPKLPITV